ncbi:hypothetical protein BRD00_05200 [Halobacteriales archaeon QS_8_69_26]|nr:MAG: hypothetical protein BRD00_05200 [Halobacteriales archaeon QS_8_69_26]
MTDPGPGNADDGDPEDLPPAFRRTLAAAFPDRQVARAARPGGSDHPGNDVLRVTFADGGGPGAAYLKVATDGDAGRIRRAAALSEYAGHHAAVRTPAVLAADPGADPPYLASAPLSGRPLADRIGGDRHDASDDRALVAVLRGVGRATAGLHAARFDRAGAVRGGDADGLDLAGEGWASVLRAVRLDPMSLPDRFGDLPGRAADLLESSAGRIELGDGEATVVHDDLHSENVFATDSGTQQDRPGILDFEVGMVGDPSLDLVRTEDLAVDGRPDLDEGTRERIRVALFDGYRTGARAHGLPVGPDGLPRGFDDRRPVYRVVTFLRTAITFESWAPDGPEPVDEMAAWVRDEFDQRVRNARA